MEEDDLDFTPTQGTSTNLASLFGFTKKPLQGNPTLTYTAPKAPKKDSAPLKNQQQAEEKKCKAVIICSSPVQAYKLENRSYVNQGLAGIVISGNHEEHMYAIIIYKPSKEHLSRTTITRTFALTLSANNYVSFYDNTKKNWSLMFQSTADMKQFVEKVAISKFYCQSEPSQNILIQDLLPASNSVTYTNSVVDVTYSVFSLDQESLAVLKENIKEKINLSTNNSTLAKGLVGCSENLNRIIIVPHSLSDSSFNDLGSIKDLLFKVKVDKIISQLESSLMSSACLGDGTESPVESSTEETSIKTKGDSIKQALASTKSQKANLISRMARMGQATLPLKQELDGPTDSEEEISAMPSPKPRISRNRQGINSHHNSIAYTSQTSIPETAKQLSLYQNDTSWEQGQLTKFGVPHQLIPVSPHTSWSETKDSGLGVYMSESRIQAAELRMSISKISEKMDTVLNKVQNFSAATLECKTHQPPFLDSSAILSSIQNLITENEMLKAKVAEQKEKLEQQNDRIFHLLELNHKYLEQSSTSNENQTEIELKLRKEIEVYLRKELQWQEENKKYLERVKILEGELEKSEEARKKMKERTDELMNELDNYKKVTEGNDNMKKLIESYDEKITEASSIIMKSKAKLKEAMSEKETLKSMVEAQKEIIEGNKTEIEDLKIRNKEFEKTVEGLKEKVFSGESKHDSAVDYYKKLVEKLQNEKKNILSEFENEKEKQKKEMEKNMNIIFSSLKESFSESSEYSTTAIWSIVEKCFDNFSFIESEKGIDKKNLIVESEKSFAANPPASSIQSDEIIRSKDNDCEASCNEIEKKLGKTEIKEHDNLKEKNFAEKEIKEEGNNSRYYDTKSYDQNWRTIKPPPLLDDEDDDDDWLN